MRITLPVIFGFIAGAVMFVNYFVNSARLQFMSDTILDWKQVVIGITLILGLWSLLRYHMNRWQRRDSDWAYSIVAIVGFFVMVGAGIYSAVTGGLESGPYNWMFESIQAPMQSTMFALLAFYVASASYRAFRARSLHAALLLIAGVIVMLGRVPLGDFIGVDVGGTRVGNLLGVAEDTRLGMASLTAFILDVPNLAAKTGILIGVGLGIVATALKILLGIERTYLGRGSGS